MFTGVLSQQITANIFEVHITHVQHVIPVISSNKAIIQEKTTVWLILCHPIVELNDSDGWNVL